ncbi:hypothetical protein LTR10_011506 [Elasticomyces elasticus]|uniref:Uncharacterized protein n=1 Tax=Exophiala sideris TaxID=1016849 RepID=A0ABR0JCM7_9EURO|nr:hypothetical protein LTR10_011506 [Elasticomyces elasticus]KAK5032037.1 hypothetical protein LTS07_004659 [Exophiala sideris]KAK5040965.1 hypothetical protein LTR13_003267 [Exophiala sideris]KAK5061701.1 hypothetical protein LTR69_004883 [Exophiala sideris]KAK5184401.1 hypothetical protein LTR44_003074 [Eurotiomycetes sp. CCFEE 6388]
MPSKYSHSVVLASYSSQGIITSPGYQEWDFDGSHGSSTPVNVYQQEPPPRSDRRKSNPTTTTLSAFKDERRTKRHSKPHNKSKKHESSSYFGPVPDQTAGSNLDKSVKTSRRRDAAKHDAPQQRLSVAKPQGGASPDFRLSGPFDPFAGAPEFIPNVEETSPEPDLKGLALISPEPEIRGQQDANTSRPIRRSIEPRNDVQQRPTIKTPERSAVRVRRNGSEQLLSIQQFLDMSPRINGSVPPAQRRSSQPQTSLNSHPPSLSPAFHAKPTRPPAQKMDSSNSLDRSATSFIDSSDDEDEVLRKSARSLHRRPFSVAARPQRSAPQPDFAMELAELQGASRRNSGARRTSQQTIPTRNRHNPPAQNDGARRTSQYANPTPKRQSRRHSTEIDDSDAFDDLPLQRHSPLPMQTPERKTLRRTGSLQSKPLFDVPDELLSPLPPGSPYSPGSVTPWTTISNAEQEPDFSGFSDKAEPDDYLSNDMSSGYVHVNKRYYRSTHDHVTEPDPEPEPRSHPSHLHSDIQSPISPISAQAPFSPTYPVPDRTGRTSRISSVSQQRPSLSRSRGPESRTPAGGLPSPTSEPGLRSPSINSSMSIPRKPVNPMPHFGTPSVIRDPQELAKLNVQNVSRSTTPMPVKGKPSPQTFLQQQRQRLRSSSELARTSQLGRSSRSLHTPEPVTQSSAASIGSSRRPSVQSPGSANFGEEGWGRVSVEPAGWNGSFAHLGTTPAAGRSQASVARSAAPEQLPEEEDDEDAALPPPDITRRRQSEDVRAGSALSSRGQSRIGVRGGIDGLQDLLQEQDHMPTQQTRNRSRSILSRFSRRR